MEAAGVLLGDLPLTLHLPRPGFGLYLLLGALALVGLFLLFFIIVCLCERQRLAGDLDPASEPYPFPPTPYWKATRADAFKCGLRHAGDYATRKDLSLEKRMLSLFVSQDCLVVTAVITGALAVARTQKTVLRSRLADGRVLESSDQGGVDDPSGVMDRAILFNAGIAELMDFHAQRIKDSSSTVLPLKPDAPLQEYERMELERGTRWVLMGLARWVDSQQTSIRLTFRGSLTMVRVLLRQFTKVRGQTHRVHIRRAGSRPGD